MLAENGVKLKMKAASYAQYLMGKGQSFVSNALICDLRRGVFAISAAEDQLKLCMSIHAS